MKEGTYLRKAGEVRDPRWESLRGSVLTGLHLFLHMEGFAVATLVHPRYANSETSDLLVSILTSLLDRLTELTFVL